jgi:hypothetical protein
MSFRYGNKTAVFLDSLEASPYLNSADSSRTIATSDVTAFGATAKAFIAGEEDATLTAAGFFDGGVGAIDEKLWNLMGITGSYPGTYCPDGGAIIGRQARLYDLVETNVTPSSPIGGAVTIKLTAQVTGGEKHGKVLNDNTQTSTTIPGTSVDWGVNGASSNGGKINIHVPFNTWSATTAVKLQHSTDNTVWVDLAGAAQTIPAGQAVDVTHPNGLPSAYTLTLSGAVNRYVRAVITPAAGTGAISAVVAFARF